MAVALSSFSNAFPETSSGSVWHQASSVGVPWLSRPEKRIVTHFVCQTYAVHNKSPEAPLNSKIGPKLDTHKDQGFVPESSGTSFPF